MRTLVFVGAGHTHTQVMLDLNKSSEYTHNVRLVLVSDHDKAFYSGMIPGAVHGVYGEEECVLDVPRFCARLGWEYVSARCVGIARASRTLTLETGPANTPSTLHFDLLSVDVGSTSQLPDGTAVRRNGRIPDFVVPTRPISELVGRLDKHERRARDTVVDRPLKVLVVGGGAAGVELAFTIEARFRRAREHAGLAHGVRVVLVDRNSGTLPDSYCRQAADIVMREFDARGIEYVDKTVAMGFDEAQRALIVRSTDSGSDSDAPRRALICDVCVVATGAAAHPWQRTETDLTTDERGFFSVHDTLASVDDPLIFVCGDCASLQSTRGRFPPKAGVYAVRHGPILLHNLREVLAHGTTGNLRTFSPQSEFLSLLNLGNGSALGNKHGIAFVGPWVWHLKDYIDRSWMDKFADSPTTQQQQQQSTESTTPAHWSAETAAQLLASRTDTECLSRWALLKHMACDADYCDRVCTVYRSLSLSLSLSLCN